jgi:hypothetical protein
MKKRLWISIILFVLPLCANAQLINRVPADSILGHRIQRSPSGTLQAWYKSAVPGAGYVHVAALASEFIKNGVPTYDPMGLPMIFITCCFQGPQFSKNGQFVAEDWPHNPACVWAGLVQGLALDYRVFSGDESYVDVVRKMLDYQLQHGTTPAEWPWPNVPFASADPFMAEYQGAGRWESDGVRGDGLHGIEPDKIGELGIAYLKFYQVTEEERFLQAAINCAAALAKQVRDVRPGQPPFSEASTEKSPWPFRVNARNGVVISDYCSNVIEPIRLFDELLRIRQRIGLSDEQAGAFQKARGLAWEWLYSINGPMTTYIWNAYFEDVPNDPGRTNRLQITPMETARYLIKHPELDPNMDKNVPALIHWVASAFATEGMDAIKEQTWCYAPMGSHTSRYASLCALWYERTGDGWYRDQAERFFNLATYMCQENGVVSVGPQWPGSWWSDGYGDYIRHFMEGLASVPEWAPAGENHLLRSTSVIQKINYGKAELRYQTFDNESLEIVRLSKKPLKVRDGDTVLSERSVLDKPGWTWKPLGQGGIAKIRHETAKEVVIKKSIQE